MKVYVQNDGNSKGMRVEVVKEEDYRMTLKIIASNMEYTVGKPEFVKHYVSEDDSKPYQPTKTVRVVDAEDDGEKVEKKIRKQTSKTDQQLDRDSHNLKKLIAKSESKSKPKKSLLNSWRKKQKNSGEKP